MIDVKSISVTFGMDKVKNCLSIAIIPFWVEDKFFEIPVHVAQGNLELLLGQQFLRDHKVFIDCYSQKIKYGQGKWVATVSTDRGLLRIPTVPLDTKIITPSLKYRNKRRKIMEKVRLVKSINNYNVNEVIMNEKPNSLGDALQQLKEIITKMSNVEGFFECFVPEKTSHVAETSTMSSKNEKDVFQIASKKKCLL